SRTGPFNVRNGGTVLPGAIVGAFATCGLILGLVPPTSGNAWHPAHESKLKRGPRPSSISSTSENVILKAAKAAASPAASAAKGPPAPGAPPRTPGSVGPEPVTL